MSRSNTTQTARIAHRSHAYGTTNQYITGIRASSGPKPPRDPCCRRPLESSHPQVLGEDLPELSVSTRQPRHFSKLIGQPLLPEKTDRPPDLDRVGSLVQHMHHRGPTTTRVTPQLRRIGPLRREHGHHSQNAGDHHKQRNYSNRNPPDRHPASRRTPGLARQQHGHPFAIYSTMRVLVLAAAPIPKPLLNFSVLTEFLRAATVTAGDPASRHVTGLARRLAEETESLSRFFLAITAAQEQFRRT